jgi:hypothetical protein
LGHRATLTLLGSFPGPKSQISGVRLGTKLCFVTAAAHPAKPRAQKNNNNVIPAKAGIQWKPDQLSGFTCRPARLLYWPFFVHPVSFYRHRKRDILRQIFLSNAFWNLNRGTYRD